METSKEKFTVLDNLIVKPHHQEISSDFNVIGHLEREATENKYFPSFFSDRHNGTCIVLYKYKIIESEIKLNEYFKIVKIYEQRDTDRSRNFYRELIFEVEDLLHARKKFDFETDPRKKISHLDIQRSIRELFKTLELEKSFEIMELKLELKKCEEKNKK